MKKERKHAVSVEGHENNLQGLTQEIFRMRYDQVVAFLEYALVEINRQAEGDRARGRAQLADLLREAADGIQKEKEIFERIWALCEPHMKGEMG